MTTGRALWRLLRCALHLMHGLAVVGWSFPRADLMGRQRLIGWWSGKLVRLLGIELVTSGAPPAGGCLVVVNHVSWLDFAVVQALCPAARFVSKANVRHWPLLGWLAAGAGTLFIERERKRDALRVVHDIAAALRAGGTVAVFPEGTTGPGPTLLPFHTNLFQAAIAVEAQVQPVVLRYSEPAHAFSTAVQYLDDTTLIGSGWRIACARGLVAQVHFCVPQPSGPGERRALGEAIRRHMEGELALAAAGQSV